MLLVPNHRPRRLIHSREQELFSGLDLRKYMVTPVGRKQLGDQREARNRFGPHSGPESSTDCK